MDCSFLCEKMSRWTAIACRILFASFLLLLLPSETSLVKIHRAVPRAPKGKQGYDEKEWLMFSPDLDFSQFFIKKEAWFYTIPATILVGMCGIFPLLIIPVEAGRALREGGM